MERTKQAINVLHTAKIRQSEPVNLLKSLSFEGFNFQKLRFF